MPNLNNVFQTYHPAVAFAFLASATVLCMAALHPAYVCLSLAGAFACSCVTRGACVSALSLRWIIPLCLIVAAANPLFSASGSTELFAIPLPDVGNGPVYRTVYLESVLYGLCAGGMFAAVFLWFASYSACMTSENFMALFGNVAPVVAFMVSQVLRLVPQFVKRGRAIAQVQDAASAAAPQGKREEAAGRMRIVNVLMGWGMEDGLERSQAMRARGYGCGVKRTTYRRFRFGRMDAALLAAILSLAVLNAALMYVAVSQFSFYPVMSTLVSWWGYACYAAFLAIPVILHAKEWWQWKSCR